MYIRTPKYARPAALTCVVTLSLGRRVLFFNFRLSALLGAPRRDGRTGPRVVQTTSRPRALTKRLIFNIIVTFGK